MRKAQSSKKFIPNFPHAHYHSYAIENREMVDINPALKLRAEDVLEACQMIGAKSVMDVGSNLGGFLYYLEQFGGFSQLLGIEGDKRFTEECEKVSEKLNSNVEFINKPVMGVNALEQPYDTLLLQNVYHYIYDKEGSHQKIFEKFSGLARSIIWYNPMTADDPVIGAHANSNKDTDWGQYNHKDIFMGAIKAGFLHPIRDRKSRFGGMGSIREHWFFIRDNVIPIQKKFLSISDVSGDFVNVADHYSTIHYVKMNDKRSFKIFHGAHTGLAEIVVRLVDMGVIDATLCPDLQFILNESGEVVGYSQPRGLEISHVSVDNGAGDLIDKINLQRWKIFSRMLRHNVFSHDLGDHNFVLLADNSIPAMIDLENFVFDASKSKALSVYRKNPDKNEYLSAEANLKLFFGDVHVDLEGFNSISVMQVLLHESKFLNGIRLNGIL